MTNHPLFYYKFTENVVQDVFPQLFSTSNEPRRTLSKPAVRHIGELNKIKPK